MSNVCNIYNRIIEKFSDAKIGVVGDLIADVYVYGKPSRLSREAPVVVIEYESEEIRPGGAANCANNLSALGASVFPIGVVGQDEKGRLLKEVLCRGKVVSDGVIAEDGRETPTKTRILAGDSNTAKQQMARIDRGKPAPISISTERILLDMVGKFAKETSAWIISDYGYGLISDRIREKVRDLFPHKIVVADSRYAAKEFGRITAITPNEAETLSFGKYYLNDEEDIFVIGEQILEILHLAAVLVTRGNKGMVLFEKGKKPVEIPIVGTEEIVDVSGAGDTVAATFTLSLACGASFEQAAYLANCAASVVVMKRGTATCSKDELLQTIHKYADRL